MFVLLIIKSVPKDIVLNVVSLTFLNIGLPICSRISFGTLTPNTALVNIETPAVPHTIIIPVGV
jgi:hypothetical protein